MNSSHEERMKNSVSLYSGHWQNPTMDTHHHAWTVTEKAPNGETYSVCTCGAVGKQDIPCNCGCRKLLQRQDDFRDQLATVVASAKWQDFPEAASWLSSGRHRSPSEIERKELGALAPRIIKLGCYDVHEVIARQFAPLKGSAKTL